MSYLKPINQNESQYIDYDISQLPSFKLLSSLSVILDILNNILVIYISIEFYTHLPFMLQMKLNIVWPRDLHQQEIKPELQHGQNLGKEKNSQTQICLHCDYITSNSIIFRLSQEMLDFIELPTSPQVLSSFSITEQQPVINGVSNAWFGLQLRTYILY